VEVYIPLGVAQNLAGMSGEVTQIYVQAAGAGDIATVQSEIDKTVSGAIGGWRAASLRLPRR
jgi:putative ABC transport system permease protein